MSILFLFIDGLGIGTRNPALNPCAAAGSEFLSCFDDGDAPLPAAGNGFLIPTRATLGVEGLPQSATGQTTLFTGINAAKHIGRHLQGYPNASLRNLLRESSILKRVTRMGLKSAFLNAYRPLFFELRESTQWRLSTTTVATLSAGLPFFKIEDIARHRSLYHDFTNISLVKKGFDAPIFTPKEAAGILVNALSEYDFVLYEYFLTDRAGHSQDMDIAVREIQKLDALLSELLSRIDTERTVVLLTSDHGNIEDLSTRVHTRNRVPTLIWGERAKTLKDRIRSLEDITPAILCLLDDRQPTVK